MLAISSQYEEDENELSYTRRKVTVHSQSTTNFSSSLSNKTSTTQATQEMMLNKLMVLPTILYSKN